ncbi:exopolyphosphatase [Pedobacter yulinensis]|uniref:Exopolyphosphatase n=1 Tax=Pedobacter yulinensis TaxID=2126353 RepID=A0A2T3HH97_9SPHI|nr:exopolyphosphatase [Pedobacter yulinensis]PST81773.1 exopolyphosphatase [Pedobacter yulinensis]
MRAAIIDMGTNTFHLLVANVVGAGYEILYRTSLPVKLGQGRINENILIPEAMQRGIAALKTFAATIEEYGATEIRATATSAVRSARNGREFVALVKNETGIEVKVISGDTEAQLIYQGVRLTGAIEGTSLIMDIGGGSVEFILCTADEVIWKKSYDIGAARLMQQFFHSDPLTAGEREAMRAHFVPLLEDLVAVCRAQQPQTLIGSAGAFETFIQLLAAQQGAALDLSQVAAADIDIEAYRVLSLSLQQATHAERASMKGMIPLRVDMIVVAALLTDYMLDQLNPGRLRLSTFDLKMGVLAAMLG